MPRTNKTKKVTVADFHIRVNQSEYQQLEAAAKYQRRSITSFILNAALEQAGREIEKQQYLEDYFAVDQPYFPGYHYQTPTSLIPVPDSPENI